MKYVCETFLAEETEKINKLCSEDLARRIIYRWNPTWRNPLRFTTEQQVLRYVLQHSFRRPFWANIYQDLMKILFIGTSRIPTYKEYPGVCYKRWVKDEPYVPVELKLNYKEII